MDTLNLIDTFSEFKEFKNIDREAMMHILSDVFKAMLAKKYGSDEYFDIIVNIDKGDLEVYHNRTVVEDGKVEDELAEIEYSEAIKIEPDFEVGDEVAEVVNISSFGRREILAIRQNLQTKIMEYEKENIYLKYKDKVGEVVNVEVSQSWRKEIIAVDDESAAENFVTAVLAVHLRETKHFAVGERTAEALAKSFQVIHFFGAESQTFRLIVGFNIVDINDRIRRTSDSEGVAV